MSRGDQRDEMKLKLTPIMPFAQKSVCSFCGKERYSASDFAIAYTDGKLMCYECEKNKLNANQKTSS